MRAADIKVYNDYRVAYALNGSERARAVTHPNGGHLRVQMVDPLTGDPVGHVMRRPTRYLVEPWEDYAEIWAERQERAAVADGAADALEAALAQRGIIPRQGPYANSDAAVPYVRLALSAVDADELAGWLAGMPENIRAAD